jgi:hypothetical protein
MQVEGVSRDAIELLESPFSKAPEALNAVDVLRATGKHISSVLDSEVLRVADIYKAVVSAPAVGVDDGLRCDATADNSLSSGLLAVRHDLRIDLAVTLEEAEDDCFT